MQAAVDTQGNASAVFVHKGDEGKRIAAIKRHASVPAECGPDIPAAPARARLARYMPRETQLDSYGRPVTVQAGHKEESEAQRRSGARVSDVWDLMLHQSKKAYQRRQAQADKDGDTDFPSYEAPYSAGQISAARDYAALVERVDSSGVKCSSVEALGGSPSGAGTGREEAIFRDFERLRVLRRRIGEGLAKSAQRPSKQPKGDVKRSVIRVRALVDMVALGDKSLSDVLESHGWAKTGANRMALKLALCSALDRMQGYDLASPQ